MRVLKILAVSGAIMIAAALLASSASAESAVVTVVNPATHPIPVSGSVAVTNTVPVSITNPVTLANPVSNVTVGNTTANPIPVTITGGAPGVASGTPYYGALSLSASNTLAVMGPGNGTLNVGTIQLTNSDPAPQLVSVFAPILGTPEHCDLAGGFRGHEGISMRVYVQPYTTLVIPYPTPLVFRPVSTIFLSGSAGVTTCIAASIETQLTTGTVEVDVTGLGN